MNDKVSIDDFTEETYWVLECPNCDSYIEVYENPEYMDCVVCPFCNSGYDIV